MKISLREKNVTRTDVKLNKKIIWIIWLILVIIWNYGYPQASPFQDVLAAVIFWIISTFLQKIKI